MSRARSLVTAAQVLYGVFGVLLLLLGAAFIAFLGPGGLFGLFFLGSGVFQLILILIVHETIQTPLKWGNVARASNPALILGIVTVLLANVISGILLLVAYAKINRAEALIPPAGPSVPHLAVGPPGTPPAELRYCPSCRSPLTPPYQYCTHCGHRLPSVPGPPTND